MIPGDIDFCDVSNSAQTAIQVQDAVICIGIRGEKQCCICDFGWSTEAAFRYRI